LNSDSSGTLSAKPRMNLEDITLASVVPHASHDRRDVGGLPVLSALRRNAYSAFCFRVRAGG
jgi:hypothetical protein